MKCRPSGRQTATIGFRGDAADCLAEAVARWAKAGNRVLVTSRPYGLDGRSSRTWGLPPAPILGLDSPYRRCSSDVGSSV